VKILLDQIETTCLRPDSYVSLLIVLYYYNTSKDSCEQRWHVLTDDFLPSTTPQTMFNQPDAAV